MHQSSFHRMKRFIELFLIGKVDQRLSIVDLGSRDVHVGSYASLFSKPRWFYQGVDIVPGDNVHLVLKDKYHWEEIPEDSVDVLVSGSAFEHIEFIWLSMLEVRRVLKPGGLCCLIAPSRGFVHRYPVDCWRIQPDGWRALAKYAKLNPVICQTEWESLPQWQDDSKEWDDVVFVAEKEEGPAL